MVASRDPGCYQNWLRLQPDVKQRYLDQSRKSTLKTLTIADDFAFADLGTMLTEIREDYILFSHPDASVDADGLALLTVKMAETGAGCAYSDEDQVRKDNGRCHPFFKPDFSIDLQLRYDFVGPVFVADRRRLEAALGMYKAKPSSSYELLLALHLAEERIIHVSRIIVSWERPRSRSVPHDFVTESYWRRRYTEEFGLALCSMDQRKKVLAEHSVSIVVPTKDRLDLLSKCIESILESSNDIRYEIIVLDNGSKEQTTLQWLVEAEKKWSNVRVIDANYPFNWAKLCNHGVNESQGSLVLLLNNDVEVTHSHWLDALAIQALRPEIGIVGAQLRYPDGSIQHAGVVIGMGGFADHIYAAFSPSADDCHIFVSPLISRRVLACTGACMMIERSKFDAIGQFDTTLPICADVEICVRFNDGGLQNLYEADVVLTHHESATRKFEPMSALEIESAKEIFHPYLTCGDPFFNSRLSQKSRYPIYKGW